MMSMLAVVLSNFLINFQLKQLDVGSSSSIGSELIMSKGDGQLEEDIDGMS